MRTHTNRIIALLAVLAAPLGLRADDRSFEPERHFPADCYLWVSVDVGGMRSAFEKTPVGAIVSHPEIRRGLGALPDKARAWIRNELRAMSGVLGRDVLEFADLFSGRVTFASTKDRFLAVELGANRDAILDAVNKLGDFAASRELVRVSESEVIGRRVTTLRFEGFPLLLRYTVLGNSLVAVLGEGLEEVVARFDAGDTEAGEDDAKVSVSPLWEKSAELAGIDEPLATFFFDMREWLRLLGSPGSEAIAAMLRPPLAALGFDGVEFLTWRLRVREGDWESRLVLKNSGPFRGFLKVATASLTAPDSREPLAKVPASASRVTCFAAEPGGLLRGAMATLKRLFPPLLGFGPIYEQATKAVESATGLSLEEDIFKLPRINVYAFQVTPPAGGLVPDSLALVRSAEAKPYLELLRGFLAKLGAEPRTVEIPGGTAEYLRVGGLLDRLGLGVLGRGVPQPGFSLTSAPLDDEWLVLADSPQAVSRYITHYAKAEAMKHFPEDLGVSGKDGSRAAVTMLRGNGSFLMAYNALVDVGQHLSPELSPVFGAYGIDPSVFPPAEELAPRFRTGFIVLRRSDDAVVLHTHRLVTNCIGDGLLDAFRLAAVFADFRGLGG